MTSAEIRQSFLDFFREQQHTIVRSASLMPDSPGLLFTNAGMNQFVPIFLNERKPDVSKWGGAIPGSDTRAADTQKCIRAGGKHNDLEDVGWDTYHHTLFEMLGNWSFGDYFKKESLTWGWKLLTEVWGIPTKRLFATVYSPDKSKNDPADFDQEAYDIWAKIFRDAGLDPDVHIINGNKKDNFWMMGETGPCGPCSEIHFNLMPDDDEKAGRKLVNNDSPRCIEIWNHVFIQFNAGEDGSFSPLPAKHVDTGMGFERVAGIHAGTKGFTDFTAEPSNYDADIFKDLFAKLSELTGGKHAYKATVPKKREGISEQEKTDVAFRVVADHVRCVSCAIADGIIPGNSDRNYVIRRILRRGILYGRKDLGLETGFFEKLVPSVVAALGPVFPELKEQQSVIERVIRSEEESFGRTLDKGLQIFEQETAKLPGSARVPRAASGVTPDASANSTRYSKRRLPHFERPWAKYIVTFSTKDRTPLGTDARRIVLDSLVHGHDSGRYHLYAACVMPDHAHALLEPAPNGTDPDGNTTFHTLTDILHSVKSFTAHEINKLTGKSSSVWEKESFDRIIRSESDLHEKFNYVVENPRRAAIVGVDENYPFVWTTTDGPRRDAADSTRDACAPQTIPGTLAFELYDTFGFPLDMTQLLATERGLTVDVEGFQAAMEKQRDRARAAHKKEVISVSEGSTNVATEFVGFEMLEIEANIVSVVRKDDHNLVFVDTSPFYAEMGGQVGDTGWIEFLSGRLPVLNTTKSGSAFVLTTPLTLPLANTAPKEFLGGDFKGPLKVKLIVDAGRRRDIQRHHTATHLLHWALREVLGTHVRQAGSLVRPEYLRFDFAHFEQVKPEQLRTIERMVNERVLENANVSWKEVPYSEVSGRKDIMQFFGDKYGETVRVVQIGGERRGLNGYSMELCGGTHATATGEVGLIKISGESAIAAGTRRLEAVVGNAALGFVEAQESQLKSIGAKLSAGPNDVEHKLDSVLAQNAELQKQLKSFQQKAEAGLADELSSKAVEKDGLKTVVAKVDAGDPNALRQLGAQILGKLGEGVVVLGAVFGDDKVSVVALCSPGAIKAGKKAGDIVRETCAKLGGKGGGKPDFAMGGGKDAAGLGAALDGLR